MNQRGFLYPDLLPNRFLICNLLVLVKDQRLVSYIEYKCL